MKEKILKEALKMTSCLSYDETSINYINSNIKYLCDKYIQYLEGCVELKILSEYLKIELCESKIFEYKYFLPYRIEPRENLKHPVKTRSLFSNNIYWQGRGSQLNSLEYIYENEAIGIFWEIVEKENNYEKNDICN